MRLIFRSMPVVRKITDGPPLFSRGNHPPTLPNRGCSLVTDAQTESHALRPEVGLIEAVDRANWAEVAAELRTDRQEYRVDDGVDLVARPHQPADVQAVVTDVSAQALCPLVAQLECHFRHVCEFIVRGIDDVARKGQHATLDLRVDAEGSIVRESAHVQILILIAERDLSGQVGEEPTMAQFHLETELSAEELVATGEFIEDIDERRIGGIQGRNRRARRDAERLVVVDVANAAQQI
jgi:hypothetical protein